MVFSETEVLIYPPINLILVSPPFCHFSFLLGPATLQVVSCFLDFRRLTYALLTGFVPLSCCQSSGVNFELSPEVSTWCAEVSLLGVLETEVVGTVGVDS